MNDDGGARGVLPSSLTRRSLLAASAAGAAGATVAPGLLRAAATGSAGHVVVIGAGVFGAWTAHHLFARGHRVTLVDAFGPAHSRASSGGESRMTRAAYGKDAIYARMARDSLVQWRALEVPGGAPVFVPHGVLFFFASEDPYLTESLATHRQLGLPTKALTGPEMARRFPMIDFTGVAAGLFEPGFGGLMARRSVQLLVERFVAAGGHYRLGAAGSVESAPGSRLAAIQLTSGESVAGDHFVFALGPWLPKLFPQTVGRRIRPTRQEVFFFAPPAGDRRFQPGAMPGWADFNGGDVYYGFPDLEARGVKFAHDAHGADVDPDRQARQPSREALARVTAFRDRRFPLLRGAALTEARVCQYENSSNGDFLIDFHPRLANVLLVGGGSGHGFKHGPEVGRYAALRLVKAAAPEPRFSLATKALHHDREVI